VPEKYGYVIVLILSVSGTNEQSVIFHIMNQSAGLEKKVQKKLHNRRWSSWWN
jgi:hypothetical protein